MLLAYPTADLYTVVDSLPEKHRALLAGRTPITTFIQKLPFARSKHWLYLPVMPFAIEQLDMSAYDIILSSSYYVAKGVLSSPDQVHISYVHTPVRYAWHLQHQYLKEMRLERGFGSFLARVMLHYMRIWDLRSAVGVDTFIANSSYVARQVNRLYGRACKVIHPPVDLDRFYLETEKDDYYVTASRQVPYKRIDLIVKAFARMPHLRLKVIGDGPERKRIDEAAKGHDNIEILGYQADAPLTSIVAKARAFVFAAIEDFGIAPVEAQACGTPVIALAKGGTLETVRAIGCEDPTGVYFPEQTEDAIIAAVSQFELNRELITPQNCRKNAEKFSNDRFRCQLLDVVSESLKVQEAASASPNLSAPVNVLSNKL